MAKQPNIKGIGVDAFGNQVVDPTKNVLQVVEAAVQRINDLAEAHLKSSDELRKADEKLRDYQVATIKEETQLAIAHLTTIQDLHQSYGQQLEVKETERLNEKAKAEEVQRTIERERDATAALLLSKTVDQNADKLRYELASTKTENNERLTRIEGVILTSTGKSIGTANTGEWIIRIILFLIAISGFVLAFVRQ